MKLNRLIELSSQSGFYNLLLNIILRVKIPFNKPHRFRVKFIHPTQLIVTIPYIRKNKNHINSIHACALATASEFASGICLASALPENAFRIILKSLNMQYHFQAKSQTFISFEMSPTYIQNQIVEPLKKTDAILIECTVKAHDVNHNHISTGLITWQIKKWDKVKTPV